MQTDLILRGDSFFIPREFISHFLSKKKGIDTHIFVSKIDLPCRIFHRDGAHHLKKNVDLLRRDPDAEGRYRQLEDRHEELERRFRLEERSWRDREERLRRQLDEERGNVSRSKAMVKAVL